ncbi:MAG: hypothetical protein M1839_008078 [Geoglossum umbratile]|nr:MAG: hypothetical protein M1839_008078 [Geoglossum umbratile]
MSPPKKRRITKAGKPISPVPNTRNLFPSARVTKAQPVFALSTQKRVFGAEAEPIRVVNDSCQSKNTRSSKRKLAETGDSEVEDVRTSSPAPAKQTTTQNDSRAANRGLVRSHMQEQQVVQGNLVPASSQLSPKTTHLRNSAPSPNVLENPTSTLGDRHEQLPEALQDLVKLHSSFLTALSLHQAHNGALTPADLRHLTPNIGRAWGRRKVTTNDVRRTLGILQHKPPVHSINSPECSKFGLKLSDYGNGKICVEISQDPKFKPPPDRPIDVDDLNTLFTQNLYGYWKFWCSTTDDTVRTKATVFARNDSDIEADASGLSPGPITRFIQHLPMATIDICPSLNKMSSLFTKGQKRLEEFRSAVSPMGRKECSEARAGSSLVGDHQAIARRGSDLLERVRAKELQKSVLPLPMSKAAMHRKSALQRLDEVISILTHLSTSNAGLPRIEHGKGLTVGKPQASTDRSPNLASLSSIPGQQRVSLPLATLVLHLKNSLTNPISREEAEKCIQLLVDEVAPDWVKTVTLGEITAVIINKGARVGVAGWKGRVKM